MYHYNLSISLVSFHQWKTLSLFQNIYIYKAASFLCSYYDSYRGVIVYFRVVDGRIKRGDRIYFMASDKVNFLDSQCSFHPLLLSCICSQQKRFRKFAFSHQLKVKVNQGLCFLQHLLLLEFLFSNTFNTTLSTGLFCWWSWSLISQSVGSGGTLCWRGKWLIELYADNINIVYCSRLGRTQNK